MPPSTDLPSGPCPEASPLPPILSPTNPEPVYVRPVSRQSGEISTSLFSVNYYHSNEERIKRVKHCLLMFDSLCRNGDQFGAQAVGRFFESTDVVWVDDEDRPLSSDESSVHPRGIAKFVAAITVTEEMCNVLGILAGGCVSYMFDMITTAAPVLATGKTKVSINIDAS